jgi:hypothetical protein
VVPVLVEVDAPFGASYQKIHARLGDEYHVPVVEDAPILKARGKQARATR